MPHKPPDITGFGWASHDQSWVMELTTNLVVILDANNYFSFKPHCTKVRLAGVWASISLQLVLVSCNLLQPEGRRPAVTPRPSSMTTTNAFAM